MKKTIIYIVIILLLAISIAGATFAYFTAGATSNDFATSGHKFEVLYNGGRPIEGNLELTSSKTENMKTEVTIKVSEDSVLGRADLYLNIDEITANIANEALIWELYRTHNGETTHMQGNFLQCGENRNQKCTNNDILYLDRNYRLAKTNTTYTLYIWLDGNKIDNSAIGGSFSGYVGAKSENFTGGLQ